MLSASLARLDRWYLDILSRLWVYTLPVDQQFHDFFATFKDLFTNIILPIYLIIRWKCVKLVAKRPYQLRKLIETFK